MGKVELFWGKIFFFKVLVEGLNIIQISQSKNEGNPKLLCEISVCLDLYLVRIGLILEFYPLIFYSFLLQK